ncbi:MAG: hypothetical protein ACXABY_25620 [Candidatus Thorarchaeota archaeon]|jgi:hypothetical protein
MRLYNIGITGHHPDRFRNSEQAKIICAETVSLIEYQYYDESLQFNLGGEPGAEQWVAAACAAKGIDYGMVLPYPAEQVSEHWYDNQKETLTQQINGCAGLTIMSPDTEFDNYDLKKEAIVDSSDFVICFWEGRLFGRTYETVKYAVEKSKIVLNGLTGLSLVSRSQLEKQIDI